jgi:hypothetical protein
MEKTTITKYDIIEAFRNHNRAHGYDYHGNAKSDLSAVIVFAKSNWNVPYTETQRSYRVYNTSGKIFFDGMLGNSMVGDCLDGVDLGVRLDAYQWKVEKCYFE